MLLPFSLGTFSQVPLSFLRLSRRLCRASPMALRSLYSSIGFEWNIKWSLTAASCCMQWVADMLLRKADQTSTCCRLLYHGDVPPWFPLIFRYFLGNDKNSFSLSCKISANFDTFIFRLGCWLIMTPYPLNFKTWKLVKILPNCRSRKCALFSINQKLPRVVILNCVHPKQFWTSYSYDLRISSGSWFRLN